MDRGYDSVDFEGLAYDPGPPDSVEESVIQPFRINPGRPVIPQQPINPVSGCLQVGDE